MANRMIVSAPLCLEFEFQMVQYHVRCVFSVSIERHLKSALKIYIRELSQLIDVILNLYRARKNGLQNIVKKDPGRVQQNSQRTAGKNLTKPRTSHFFGLCTYLVSMCSLTCTNLISKCLTLNLLQSHIPFLAR